MLKKPFKKKEAREIDLCAPLPWPLVYKDENGEEHEIENTFENFDKVMSNPKNRLVFR